VAPPSPLVPPTVSCQDQKLQRSSEANKADQEGVSATEESLTLDCDSTAPIIDSRDESNREGVHQEQRPHISSLPSEEILVRKTKARGGRGHLALQAATATVKAINTIVSNKSAANQPGSSAVLLPESNAAPTATSEPHITSLPISSCSKSNILAAQPAGDALSPPSEDGPTGAINVARKLDMATDDEVDEQNEVCSNSGERSSTASHPQKQGSSANSEMPTSHTLDRGSSNSSGSARKRGKRAVSPPSASAGVRKKLVLAAPYDGLSDSAQHGVVESDFPLLLAVSQSAPVTKVLRPQQAKRRNTRGAAAVAAAVAVTSTTISTATTNSITPTAITITSAINNPVSNSATSTITANDNHLTAAAENFKCAATPLTISNGSESEAHNKNSDRSSSSSSSSSEQRKVTGEGPKLSGQINQTELSNLSVPSVATAAPADDDIEANKTAQIRDSTRITCCSTPSRGAQGAGLDLKIAQTLQGEAAHAKEMAKMFYLSNVTKRSATASVAVLFLLASVRSEFFVGEEWFPSIASVVSTSSETRVLLAQQAVLFFAEEVLFDFFAVLLLKGVIGVGVSCYAEGALFLNKSPHRLVILVLLCSHLLHDVCLFEMLITATEKLIF